MRMHILDKVDAMIHADPASARRHYEELRDAAKVRLADPGWARSHARMQRQLANAEAQLAKLEAL